MDRGESLGRESPNMPRKCSRLSNEGIRGTPSSTETPRSLETPISARYHSQVGAASDRRQSSGRRRLSDESVNRASRQSARDTVGDSTYLNRLNINTPTLENVETPSHQQHMFGKFLLFLYFFFFFVSIFYMFLCFLCVFVQCCEYFQLFLCVEDQVLSGGR
jgi:hypothetical protein